jgi:phage FluMu protein Com
MADNVVELEAGMIELKCPKCKSDLEIDDYKKEEQDRTAVFCTDKNCIYHKNALIGLDRKEKSIYISESII